MNNGSPLPSSFDGDDEFFNERPSAKVWRKLREEPLIPLGCFATVFAFTGAYRALRRGDSQSANRMFRYRVGAQGFTVLAMVAGSFYYSRDRERTKELRRLEEQQNAEEKRARWLRELEARDAEEKEMRALLEERRKKREERKRRSVVGVEKKTEKSVLKALSEVREAKAEEKVKEVVEEGSQLKHLGYLVAQKKQQKEKEKNKDDTK